MNNETVIFGGGCFWCTETVFKSLRGVKYVISGRRVPSKLLCQPSGRTLLPTDYLAQTIQITAEVRQINEGLNQLLLLGILLLILTFLQQKFIHILTT